MAPTHPLYRLYALCVQQPAYTLRAQITPVVEVPGGPGLGYLALYLYLVTHSEAQSRRLHPELAAGDDLALIVVEAIYQQVRAIAYPGGLRRRGYLSSNRDFSGIESRKLLERLRALGVEHGRPDPGEQERG